MSSTKFSNPLYFLQLNIRQESQLTCLNFSYHHNFCLNIFSPYIHNNVIHGPCPSKCSLSHHACLLKPKLYPPKSLVHFIQTLLQVGLQIIQYNMSISNSTMQIQIFKNAIQSTLTRQKTSHCQYHLIA